MKKYLAKSMIVAFALGAVIGPVQASTPTVSSTVKTQLIYLVQEEKLARDVYAALATSGISRKFSNITPAEQTHMTALAATMKNYGIADPTAGLKSGIFKDSSLAQLYKTLMAKARLSSTDAISVGILIEQTDIADINKLLKSVTQSDLLATLHLLLSGSQRHLAAFQR
jgi:hypothetical protein